MTNMIKSVSTENGDPRSGSVAEKGRSGAIDTARRQKAVQGAESDPVAPASDSDMRRKQRPTEPDPQEVQYPGYFKNGGSL